MNKNLLVCANATHALHKINESENTGGGYFLEGVFAELDSLNRNKRIYPKEEYLKHLAYLRDDIKKGEPLLGELDHPEDRFEVKLKEASHKIVDLWYDANTNCVMGKIELLNTPNGKLAQSLVDQGIPLHISSRAAGTVGNDSKVSIQQIYTYDLVCKPGFAGAVLHRVNESEGGSKYNSEATKFLEESNRIESMNAAPQYGINENEVSIREVSYDASLRKEAAALKENDTKEENMEINKTTEENLEEKKKVAPVTDKPMKSVFEEGDDEEKKDDENSDDSSDDTNDEKKDGDEEGVEILSVKAVTDDDEDDVEIKDVKSEEGDSDEDKKDNDEESSDENSDENSDDNKEEKNEEKTDECGDKKEDKKETEPDVKKDALFDCSDLRKKRENFEDKFAELVDRHKRKDECRKADESLTIQKHPNLSMLNKDNMTELLKLDESQKSKVADYLNANNYCTPELVNENWKAGINYTEEVWLKYAPESYRKLYETSEQSVKDSIKNTAAYCLFETQSDINHFWENTGLMESNERRILNEKFINNMPKLDEGLNESKNDNNGLPYSKEFIQMVTEMACEYND